MSCLTTAWTWLRIQIRDLRPQLRLCLRVTIAAILSFVLGKSLNIPFSGLWAVLTAVVVTQTSVGGSLKATIEYLIGTLGGAVYAGAIAALVPHASEVSLVVALAVAVAPLALLATINPSFRVGPMTAVIVVVGSSVTHPGPVESAAYRAVYRVLEVAIGGVTGVLVSLLVFPTRAHILVIEAAASMLDLMAGVLPELLIGFTQTLEETAILQRQDRIDQAFTRLATIAVEAARERMAHLASEPDTGLTLRTLLRLRHDIVMIGRAAVVPLSEKLQARLGPPLARAAETAADYLRGSSAALIARRSAAARRRRCGLRRLRRGDRRASPRGSYARFAWRRGRTLLCSRFCSRAVAPRFQGPRTLCNRICSINQGREPKGHELAYP